MAKLKRFLIDNSGDEHLVIPQILQEKWREVGFFEEIMVGSKKYIVVEEKNPSATFQRLEINSLEIEYLISITQVNLEQEILGISTKDATPEVALIVLVKKPENVVYQLYVLFIELKSSLNEHYLEQCEKKIRAAVNRMYLLLSADIPTNPLYDLDNETVQVHFHTSIFYPKNTEKFRGHSEIDLYKILKYKELEKDFSPQEKKSFQKGEFIFPSILYTDDKVIVKFFHQNKISLSELLT